jgi:glycosyltransferase involved in cell wall biosynthesis
LAVSLRCSQMPDVVLPVLNEALALPWVLGRMPAAYRPLVVDNGSDDGSPQIAAELGAQVIHEDRRGFGSACAAGLGASEADVVCFMDADGSLDPAELPRVVDPVLRGESDLTLGARMAERCAWPLHARVANRVLMAEVRRRTSLPLRDLGPMRAARRLDLIALGIKDRRSGWPLEMVLRAHASGWSVSEVGVVYRARAGRSKVTGTVRGTVQAIGDMGALLR